MIPRWRERRKLAKMAAKARIFESEAWRLDERFAHRGYASYEEYLRHQASKLDADYARRSRRNESDVADFTRNFETIAELRGSRNVLCLGARLGAEVQALRDLGYFAVGVDLNPGADNPYVHFGDFHALPFQSGSVDAVYTNALDHAFDVSEVVGEVHRVLREGGILIVDVLPGFDEGFVPGTHEATYWRRLDDLLAAIAASGPFEKAWLRDLPTRARNPWAQALFRKVAR